VKERINPAIKAHLIRGAFYLLLLLAACAIPFALGQWQIRTPVSPAGGVYAAWVAAYNGVGNYIDQATAIAVDKAGNVYVTGRSPGVSTGNDYVTIKYNSDGQQQWLVRYNGPANGDDAAWAIAVDGSGNAYVTGQSVGAGTDDDYTTIKYNANGQQQWVARYMDREISVTQPTPLPLIVQAVFM
jgi:Beta-propeller repeat